MATLKINTNEFKYYGLIGGELQIKAYIYLACMIVNQGNVNEASKLLAETIAIETKNGKAQDFSANYGEGLTQFDSGTFNYIRQYFSASKWDNLANNIKALLLVDIRNAQYTDLRKSPLLSIIYARLLYYTINEPIPLTKDGRYDYYKKYYNSYKGASTYAKYIESSKIAVFS